MATIMTDTLEDRSSPDGQETAAHGHPALRTPATFLDLLSIEDRTAVSRVRRSSFCVPA
jgi:hypothetical protein